MWFKEYKDYPIDSPLKKERVKPGKGFSGCEMPELNGWGESFTPRFTPKKEGLLRRLLKRLLPYE